MTAFDPSAQTALAAPGPVVPQQPQQVGQNTYVTDFGDESVRQYEFELFNGRLGVTDRIYIMRPKSIVKTRQHYNDKTKFILCNSTYVRQGEMDVMTVEAECCKKLGNNNLRFAALIIRYHTDKAGQLIKPFVVPELRLWKFGVDKYLQLKAIAKEWPLDQHDLSINCSDEKFQKMTIGAMKNCIYKLPDFPADLTLQFETWANASTPKIPRELGKTMTDKEILELLGVAGAAPATMNQNDAPITDFSSIVGGFAPGGAAQQK